jgi:hypothetical protein
VDAIHPGGVNLQQEGAPASLSQEGLYLILDAIVVGGVGELAIPASGEHDDGQEDDCNLDVSHG